MKPKCALCSRKVAIENLGGCDLCKMPSLCRRCFVIHTHAAPGTYPGDDRGTVDSADIRVTE